VNVLPSGYEGFPHSVVEASSVGLPSFVSDKGGNPETKELFPALVTVLPYLDSTKWKEVLQNIPPRSEPIISQSFSEKTKSYLEILNQVMKI